MKPYTPRKRRKKLDLYKQSLHDIKHKLSADLGAFLVHTEEGNLSQMALAQQKTRNDLLKYGGDMHATAKHMGERFVKAVREFLDSIDTLTHTSPSGIDEARIRHYYVVAERLEKELNLAA